MTTKYSIAHLEWMGIDGDKMTNSFCLPAERDSLQNNMLFLVDIDRAFRFWVTTIGE